MHKNKLFSILLSISIAFCLWLYVITVDTPDYEDTISDIPVTFVNESYMNDKGLILSTAPDVTVDLTISGSRSEVIKCNRSNVTIKVDLSKVYEEGIHNLEYSISYPGDVASNAITEVNKYPGNVKISVEKWSRKEVPVNVVCVGTVPENYYADTENVGKDYATVNVEGPATVVEQIKEAVIQINLDDRKESIAQSFRYTLTDENGEPVDAESITVNAEEVFVDLKIRFVKDVRLAINLVDGGGATSGTVMVQYEPKSIKLAGSESVLAELDELVLGTINLADYLETTEFTYEIPELQGVTNLSGVTEVAAKLSFPALAMKEFTIEEFQVANVPEGMKAELITEKLTIKVRGLAGDVNRLTAEDIIATVDFTGAQIGASSFKVIVTFAEGYKQLGAVGAISVGAQVKGE